MTLIPVNKKTTEYAIENKQYGGKMPRTYLGMSSIGVECLRAQWYGWRWTTSKKIPARVNRIFTRGHLEESSIIMDLLNIGIKVFRRDGDEIINLTGEVGEKQEEIEGFQGHSGGHPDGRLLGAIEAPKTEHLLEMKTMKNSKFQTLKEKGIRKAFPTYYDQCIMYMGKLKLKRALFVATNKDNQARKYIRVKFDKKRYEQLVNREEAIILSERPPTKKYKATCYLCGWCGHHQVCHLDAPPNKSCRTCEYVDLMPKGKWQCSKTKKNLSPRKQFRGCDKYRRAF